MTLLWLKCLCKTMNIIFSAYNYKGFDCIYDVRMRLLMRRLTSSSCYQLYYRKQRSVQTVAKTMNTQSRHNTNVLEGS